MTVSSCIFTINDARYQVKDKKAIDAALFLMFILYTVCVVVGELKKTSKVLTLI